MSDPDAKSWDDEWVRRVKINRAMLRVGGGGIIFRDPGERIPIGPVLSLGIKTLINPHVKNEVEGKTRSLREGEKCQAVWYKSQMLQATWG